MCPFRLSALLLLFAVLWSSMAVFGPRESFVFCNLWDDSPPAWDEERRIHWANLFSLLVGRGSAGWLLQAGLLCRRKLAAAEAKGERT